MADMSEIKGLVESQGEAWAAYVEKTEEKFKKVEQFMTKMNRPGFLEALRDDGNAEAPTATFIDTKTKRRIPALEHKHSLAALLEKRADLPTPSMGRVLRGMALGGLADDAAELSEERKALGIVPDSAGGYTVPSPLAASWIDLLRANMVLSQAGATTVPMDSATLAIAKLTADPSVQWTGENASFTSTDPTFGAVNLTAKTVRTNLLMSLELSQDSANIDGQLQRAVTQALAHEIDKAGLQGPTQTTGVAAAPSGVMNAGGRQSVTSIGAPTDWGFVVDGMYKLANVNIPIAQIGALVAHPSLWRKMTKLATGISGDKTPLRAPDDVARLQKLWTTAAPFTSGTTAEGIIGYWPDLLFGVRQNISVRVIPVEMLSTTLQMGILAFARVDFVAARESSFCTLEGITVS